MSYFAQKVKQKLFILNYALFFIGGRHMKKIVFISLLFLASILFSPMVNAGPELSVGLAPEHATLLVIQVENHGDATAHNITLTGLNISGFVFYNNRIKETNLDVEPGDSIMFSANTAFYGLGFFTATMTVTCDEQINATGTSRGFVFIDNVYIP